MIPRHTIPLLLACGLLAVAAPGCATTGVGSVTYADTPQSNYELGEKQLEAGEWVAAAKYFAFIKSRFQFSKYAVLSELRTGDAEFGAEEFGGVARAVGAHPHHTRRRHEPCAQRAGLRPGRVSRWKDRRAERAREAERADGNEAE